MPHPDRRPLVFHLFVVWWIQLTWIVLKYSALYRSSCYMTCVKHSPLREDHHQNIRFGFEQEWPTHPSGFAMDQYSLNECICLHIENPFVTFSFWVFFRSNNSSNVFYCHMVPEKHEHSFSLVEQNHPCWRQYQCPFCWCGLPDTFCEHEFLLQPRLSHLFRYLHGWCLQLFFLEPPRSLHRPKLVHMNDRFMRWLNSCFTLKIYVYSVLVYACMWII